MRKRTFFIYATYVWTKTLLGLTLHPYTSIRDTLRRPILLPVIISPLIGLGVLLITGKIASLLIVVYDLKREIIGLLLSSMLISIVLWQILLVYLLLSFILAYFRRR